MVGHWDTRRGRMRQGGQIVQYPRICASGVKNPFGERDLACALGYGQMVKNALVNSLQPHHPVLDAASSFIGVVVARRPG